MKNGRLAFLAEKTFAVVKYMDRNIGGTIA